MALVGRVVHSVRSIHYNYAIQAAEVSPYDQDGLQRRAHHRVSVVYFSARKKMKKNVVPFKDGFHDI